MTIAKLRHVDKGGKSYDVLTFWCPGCEHIDAQGERQGGTHMLPVNTQDEHPSWTWNMSLTAPTLSPSILSRHDYWRGEGVPPRRFICHSFMRDGQMEFLSDCTHTLAGQTVPLPDLPGWLL